MPALLWVAFWSNFMGATMAWQQAALLTHTQASERRDHHSRELSEKS
jgi:hypothetical protein